MTREEYRECHPEDFEKASPSNRLIIDVIQESMIQMAEKIGMTQEVLGWMKQGRPGR